ncbi:OmpA family protein [Saccharopolyspora cebuensis]|uniref:OmpA family protein n=1 Tax=Saccharopolyspora cebuensis TaxID=418759 RepID=A0ABV4CFB3_9PSEU
MSGAPTTLTRATGLAGDGDYAEAEQLLRELGGRGSTDPAVLDLLARIHAQRGELFDADECWALALRLDADFAPARAGRQRIAALVARRMRPRGGRVALAALAAVLFTGTGVAVGVLVEQPPGPDPTVLAALAQVRDGQRDQAERLGSRGERLDRQRALDALGAVLAGDPAFLARVDADAVVVTFPTGVFRSGTSLSRTGSAALGDLARRLGPLTGDTSITVVGHTADVQTSRSPTDAELGLARARTAAERMSEAGGLPLSVFALLSSGTADRPFPTATPEGRARNRTVTVVLRPR